MRHQFFRLFTLILALVLGVSCTLQEVQNLAATPGAAATNPSSPVQETTETPRSTVTPSPVSATLEKKRATKTAQAAEAFPTSAYQPETMDFNILLGQPTDSSITLNLFSRVDMQAHVVYGLASGNYSGQSDWIELKANSPQTFTISGLAPNSGYYYQVIADGICVKEHSFQTQRAAGSDFIFTIDADPHNRDPRFNGELYATTLANVAKDHPDFHINLGDTFMTEKVKVLTYAEAESTFLDMRPYFGISGADVPLFLVNGNHEGELGWLLNDKNNDIPIWSTEIRQLYYPNPTAGEFYSGSQTTDPYLGSARDGYYAWMWGDALFVALDPFWYTQSKPSADNLDSNWNWTLGKEQYDWLRTTLQREAKYKLVFIHHLVGGGSDARGGIEFASLYEWGGENADGSYGFDTWRPGWGKPIHALLVENGVSAVFHGHDHVFVKQELDGVIYQELPQPSNTDYKNSRLATDYGYLTGDVRSSSGHLRVVVTSSQVSVEYVRAYLEKDETSAQVNGEVDFNYTILPSR